MVPPAPNGPPPMCGKKVSVPQIPGADLHEAIAQARAPGTLDVHHVDLVYGAGLDGLHRGHEGARFPCA
ncbi:hypothetical protein ACRAWF_27155 [Streptomyces sp. L7]